ncbi:MAG: hypothetical protein LBM75_05670 [Myxococcales bacterium]|jgi:hypothetical protein|nr:hypothetical protein [Myxococcales bacterium]
MNVKKIARVTAGLAALSTLSVGCNSQPVGVSPSSFRMGDGARYVAQINDVPDRCPMLADPNRQTACEAARTEARHFVSTLEPLQQICLEGNPLGNGVTSRCVVRAAIEDMDLRKIRVKIRESYPDSGFKTMDDYWFSNDAMVDIYLYSLGFLKQGDVQR